MGDTSAMDMSLDDEDDAIVLLSPPAATAVTATSATVSSHLSIGSASAMDVSAPAPAPAPAAAAAAPIKPAASIVDFVANQAANKQQLAVELHNGDVVAMELPRFSPEDQLVLRIHQVLEQCLPSSLSWNLRLACMLLTSRKSDAALLHAIAADDEMTTRLSSEWIALVCSLSYAFGGANYIAETSTSTSGVMYPPWMQSQFAYLKQNASSLSVPVAYLPVLTLSLHVLYEEWSLKASERSAFDCLRKFILVPLASAQHWADYVAYYATFGASATSISPWVVMLDSVASNLSLKQPLVVVNGSIEPPSVPTINAYCLHSLTSPTLELPRIQMNLVSTLLPAAALPKDSPISAANLPDLVPTPLLDAVTQCYSKFSLETLDVTTLWSALKSSGLNKKLIDDMPLGISWPLRELENLSKHIGLVSDSGVVATAPTAEANRLLWLRSNDATSAAEESAAKTHQGPISGLTALEKATGVHGWNDGTDFLFAPIGLRFSKDLRIFEVQRLLSSGRPIGLRPSDRQELSDHDRMVEYQTKLTTLVQRTLTLSIGRALFTLGTSPANTWHSVHVPELVTVGRVVGPQALTVSLEEPLRPDVLMWANFHNGVAAGLRIPRNTGFQLDSSWLRYNNPPAADYNAWGGVLLGIGLNGHLGSQTYDLYAILSSCHDMATVGTLLGVAASKIGTMDSVAEHMLYPHVPALLPSYSLELPTPPVVQTAAVFALGLLYQGTCHRQITEVLLDEIGRSSLKQDTPLSISGHSVNVANQLSATSVDAYSLSASLALGLVLLGRGNSVSSLTDLQITTKLVSYMIAQPTPQLTAGAKTRAPVHVTAPGATLALGLVYMKTSDATVAQHLDLPTSSFALDYFRPDVLMLRVIARGLVMWDAITVDTATIDDSCPPFIRQQMARRGGSDVPEAILSAYYHIMAGQCFLLGLRYAGSAETTAVDSIERYMLQFETEHQRISRTVGNATQRRGLQTCLCAAILAQSLILAGTGDVNLLRRIRKYHNYPSEDISVAVHMALGFLFLSGGTASLKTDNLSIALLVVSLYPRFPTSMTDNQYHLQALRHMHVLAVENRCLVTVDAVNQDYANVKVQVNLVDDQNIIVESPCLLPELSTIASINIVDNRYWPQTISVRSLPLALIGRRTSALMLRELDKEFDMQPEVAAQLSHFDSEATRTFVQFLCLGDIRASSSGDQMALVDVAKAVFRKACVNGHLDHLAVLLAVRLASLRVRNDERAATETSRSLALVLAFEDHLAGKLRSDKNHRFLTESVFVPGELDLILRS